MTGMRGDDRQPDAMFSYVSAEQRVPKDHPLRAIRGLVDDVLRDMSREFDRLLSSCSINSRSLYNLLFRWFVGMDMDEPIWDATVFTKNRDRL